MGPAEPVPADSYLSLAGARCLGVMQARGPDEPGRAAMAGSPVRDPPAKATAGGKPGLATAWCHDHVELRTSIRTAGRSEVYSPRPISVPRSLDAQELFGLGRFCRGTTLSTSWRSTQPAGRIWGAISKHARHFRTGTVISGPASGDHAGRRVL